MSENRVKSTSARRHSGKCQVCHHQQSQEIERRYLGYESEYKIALEFGVSHDAINRHAQFFGLDAKRMGDTEAMLRVVVAKGFQQFSKTGISEKSWVECIKELNRVAGKRKEPAKNPNDLEEAKRILDWHRQNSKDFSELQIYTLLIKPFFPEIRPEQLEIENSPDLEL
jgi:hypothetical protein